MNITWQWQLVEHIPLSRPTSTLRISWIKQPLYMGWYIDWNSCITFWEAKILRHKQKFILKLLIQIQTTDFNMFSSSVCVILHTNKPTNQLSGVGKKGMK